MEPFRRGIARGLFAAALCLCPLSAWAAPETGITIEAVDNYSCGQLSNNIANVDNFRSRMLSIGGYAAGARWTNGLVWPTDFTDVDLASDGADTWNFDRPGDAIAYFSGHGTCDDQTNTVCFSTAECPDVAGTDKRCLLDHYIWWFPEGRCVYSRPRSIVVDRTGTSCQSVNYSSDTVRWGEDPGSGDWAGAALNGGVNLAVIDNSCGITPDLYVPETLNAFAGVSTIALIMPTRVGDDTADVANRGRALADRYVANPWSAVGPSWTDAINSVTGGRSCFFGGGGHGIDGCGAHIALSVEVNEARAEWANGTENWIQLRDDWNDSIGWGWMAWIYTCNYDCNTYPFILW